jgi:type IV pilus assembly protein PilQ
MQPRKANAATVIRAGSYVLSALVVVTFCLFLGLRLGAVQMAPPSLPHKSDPARTFRPPPPALVQRTDGIPRPLPPTEQEAPAGAAVQPVTQLEELEQPGLNRLFNRLLPNRSPTGTTPGDDAAPDNDAAPNNDAAPDNDAPPVNNATPGRDATSAEGGRPVDEPAQGALPEMPPAVPFPRARESIPLSGVVDDVHVGGNAQRVTLVARNAPLNKVMAMLAQHMRLNVVTSNDATANVSITLQNVPLDDALDSILSVTGHTWTRHRGIIYVTSSSSLSSLSPITQGRLLRVFPLNFALASDVEPVVRGLLSPVGKTFFTAASTADNRKTRETLIVEDLPPYLDRVAEYLAHVDVPPRQVMIEAHVLEVQLEDGIKHGVNLNWLNEVVSGNKLAFEVRGMADMMAGQAALFTFEGSDLKSLVQWLQTTTDAKTLASPRVLVVNGQEARIQVGAQLGFRVTTTTQTSTLQSVNFLDVGVVLRVTPHIGPNGEVLMHVKPEVSSGSVNPSTGLPEEETTEVETDILLSDGEGVVIGGLIREDVSDIQNKLPILGNLPLIGRLFQHRDNNNDRTEIVIALVPRVVPFGPRYDAINKAYYDRAVTPVLDHQMHRFPRNDPHMINDAVRNPIRPFQWLRDKYGCQIYRLPPIEEPLYVEEDMDEVVPEPTPAETLPLPR